MVDHFKYLYLGKNKVKYPLNYSVKLIVYKFLMVACLKLSPCLVINVKLHLSYLRVVTVSDNIVALFSLSHNCTTFINIYVDYFNNLLTILTEPSRGWGD